MELFGEKARVAAGPAALAVQTGAALMPVTLWFEGEEWRGHIHPEIPVPEAGAPAQKVAAMTQQLAAVWAAASHNTPKTGTCCRRCSPPTWTPRGCPHRSRRRRRITPQ